MCENVAYIGVYDLKSLKLTIQCPRHTRIGVGVIADIIIEFDRHPIQFTYKYKAGAKNIVVTGW